MALRQHGWSGRALTGAMVVLVGLWLSGCGRSTAEQRQTVPAANAPAQPVRDMLPAQRREVEVYVDIPPTRPYYVIAHYRFPASSHSGEDMPALKEQVRMDGGDALLVRVVSGNLGRTDIKQESLVDASVITWK